MIEQLKNTFKNFNKKISNKETINKTRSENFEKFVQLGFPSRKLEDWKFSDFSNIISKKFKNININFEENKKLKFNNYIKDFEHNKIVFLNGLYDSHSFKHENEEKIHFDNLRKGPGYEAKGKNSLKLLNNAFFIDGLLLYVKKGYECNKPLIIYNVINTQSNNNFFNQKILINVEENSKLDLIIYSVNLNSEPVFLNTSNFFLVEKYGMLKLFNINELNNDDINYNFNQINVNENGIFENFVLSCYSAFFKNDIQCSLKESHSSGFINGAILSQDNQHHEIKTEIEHFGQNTKSYQKIKSVLNKNSKAIFQGKIYVDSNAQKTDGYQLSKAIMLDKDSEFDSKPELEIYADDVKCSHGSTSGNLDENAIFYLMSRGLNRIDAKKLLIKGFLQDAIETVTNEEIKKYLLKKLEVKLNEFS
tara:strand:+ start:1547 stop:2806 length:1260 start_codon:yes stop_codon:yes gene_type:complete